MAYFHKDELHLIEEGCQKLTSPISKKLREITNNNHVPIITPKTNKFVDKYFPSTKSVTKAPTNDTTYTSSALLYKTCPSKECNYSDKKQRISNTRRHKNYVQ